MTVLTYSLIIAKFYKIIFVMGMKA